MGRIKTQQIKSKGDRLFEIHGKKFANDFEKNKKLVEEHASLRSKKLRNTLAGYITKKVKQARND